MASFNKVILVGNLTRDPELRYTQSGMAVATIGLAVNRKSADGKDETTFVDITVWDKQAASCGQYLAKGASALFEGRLQTENWDDRETGKKRSRLIVVADRVQFLGGRPDDAGQQQQQQQYAPQQQYARQPAPRQPYQEPQQRQAPQQQYDNGGFGGMPDAPGPVSSDFDDQDIPF